MPHHPRVARSPETTIADASRTGGRIDRIDVLVMAAILLLALVTRGYRLDEPRAMYFDEVYHARTAMEFLQDWRYGEPHDIYEWTHPHLAKYAMAVSIALLGDDQVTAQGQLGVPRLGRGLRAALGVTTASSGPGSCGSAGRMASRASRTAPASGCSR